MPSHLSANMFEVTKCGNHAQYLILHGSVLRMLVQDAVCHAIKIARQVLRLLDVILHVFISGQIGEKKKSYKYLVK